MRSKNPLHADGERVGRRWAGGHSAMALEQPDQSSIMPQMARLAAEVPQIGRAAGAWLLVVARW